MLRSRDHAFQIVPIFHKDHMNMSFHGNQLESIVAILLSKNILLAFQMEQSGTFLENFEYDHQTLHKNFSLRYISLDIGRRISNPDTPEYPFPLAVDLFMSIQYIHSFITSFGVSAIASLLCL